jgi:hypothetical protein
MIAINNLLNYLQSDLIDLPTYLINFQVPLSDWRESPGDRRATLSGCLEPLSNCLESLSNRLEPLSNCLEPLSSCLETRAGRLESCAGRLTGQKMEQNPISNYKNEYNKL